MFTQKKFLSLPPERRHKKIAELLRTYHERNDDLLYKEIEVLEKWVGAEYSLSKDRESLSRAYHQHLHLAGISVREDRLLVRTGDRKEPLRDRLDVPIYLDGLRSAHNIGSIIRTCEAFHLGTIYFSDDMPDPDHPQIKKTSMGTLDHVPIRQGVSLVDLPGPRIAVETHRKSVPLKDYVFPPSFTLIFGNEEFGIREKSLLLADHIVEIPLYGRKNSLNVAACFAVIAAKISEDLSRRKEKNPGRR